MKLILISYISDFIPAALAVLLLLSAIRRKIFKTNKDFFSALAFALSVSAIFTVTGIPGINSLTFDPTVEFIPFVTMADDIINCILNAVLFIPVGFTLPVLCGRYKSCAKTAAFALSLSLTVEALQLFSYRTTDIDDLIMNTVGAVIGCFLSRAASKLKGGDTDARLPFLLAAASLASAFFVTPALSGVLFRILAPAGV